MKPYVGWAGVGVRAKAYHRGIAKQPRCPNPHSLVDLRGDRERVKGEREQVPHPGGDLLARQGDGAEPCRDCGDRKRHDAERDRPDGEPVTVAEQRGDIGPGRAGGRQGRAP